MKKILFKYFRNIVQDQKFLNGHSLILRTFPANCVTRSSFETLWKYIIQWSVVSLIMNHQLILCSSSGSSLNSDFNVYHSDDDWNHFCFWRSIHDFAQPIYFSNFTVFQWLIVCFIFHSTGIISDYCLILNCTVI